MALAAGDRLGSYQILARLGAGGMGEVFRARDTNLNREVAIKVLLAAVADDPERLARFRREAQLLASLNHPNIAQIFGLEDAGPVRALVMELVDGPTLAERVALGPIPLDEALPLARQIAEAVESAHERGIIHRDLKPANIKVRTDGTVKVLDFGLAKALEPQSGMGEPGEPAANPMLSPTITSPALTMRGVVLGTAAYMSPEQARGRPASTRADVWAYGCVLFEMLTGMRAFHGDDVADTMVAVLSKEPDWQRLPPGSASMRPLLERCLKKDPRQRLQAIGDARVQIEELIGGAASAATAPITPPAVPGVGLTRALALAAGAAMIALVTWILVKPVAPDRPRPVRFEIVPASAQAVSINNSDRNLAISPDGQHIVYRAGTQEELVLRALDRLDAQPIKGTAGARSPFFSPDSQWIGFFDGVNLRKISIDGGPAITICRSTIPRGASWADDGTIVFTNQDTATGLLRVSADGGEPAVLTTPDADKGERDHVAPSMLPAGRGVLFTIVPSNPAEPRLVAVLDLRTGERKILVRGGSQAEYVETGHLLYANAGTLSAAAFDLTRLALRTPATPIVEGVWMQESAAANYALSRRGTLVYVGEGEENVPRPLVWVDRNGRETPVGVPPEVYSSLRLSPDETRIALAIRDDLNDIHIFDRKRGMLRRLTQGPSDDTSPIWTPDGERIVFASNRDGAINLYSQAASGSGVVERLTSGPDAQFPSWMAPDRSGILGSEISPRTAADIVWFTLEAGLGSTSSSLKTGFQSRVDRLVQSPAIDFFPEVSPSGRYLAYHSNEAGRFEIYVRPFPRVNDGIWQVSVNGGRKPMWARDGRELFYLDGAGMLAAVPVESSGASFVFGRPSPLFPMPGESRASNASRAFDVAADGRFVMPSTALPGGVRPNPIVVVVNWVEELKAKLR